MEALFLDCGRPSAQLKRDPLGSPLGCAFLWRFVVLAFMTHRSISSAAALIAIFPLLATLSGCVPGRTPRTKTGPAILALADSRDPRLCKQPLILEPSNGETEIEAERAWLEDHHPGHGGSIQGRWVKKQRTLDVLTFADGNGLSQTVCFDVSAWFGY